MAEKCVPENEETPQMEAKSHSGKFLAKAAELAGGKKKSVSTDSSSKGGLKKMPKAKKAAGKLHIKK